MKSNTPCLCQITREMCSAERLTVERFVVFCVLVCHIKTFNRNMLCQLEAIYRILQMFEICFQVFHYLFSDLHEFCVNFFFFFNFALVPILAILTNSYNTYDSLNLHATKVLFCTNILCIPFQNYNCYKTHNKFIYLFILIFNLFIFVFCFYFFIFLIFF